MKTKVLKDCKLRYINNDVFNIIRKDISELISNKKSIDDIRPMGKVSVVSSSKIAEYDDKYYVVISYIGFKNHSIKDMKNMVLVYDKNGNFIEEKEVVTISFMRKLKYLSVC